jgi:hypothetical protein
MGRRWIAGSGQLIVCVLGFIFVLVWFLKIMGQYYGQITGDVVVKPVGWIGAIGAGLFALAWCWSLVTSLSLLSQAKKDEVLAPKENSPPKLS